ncbi:SMI1/KNR4 family protein [Priestia endophytica]|jgi:hypothetical protein|uniref:SMI1/KNR4 family protein n=1 Tax=Priestia endophytica TaxID=135735 RepID=UPI003D2C1A37
MNNKILQMINAYEEDKAFFGEASEEDRKKAENRLEVTFPSEYREYVKKYGSGGICGVEILNVEKINATVVERTERYRGLGLPKKYIVYVAKQKNLECVLVHY